MSERSAAFPVVAKMSVAAMAALACGSLVASTAQGAVVFNDTFEDSPPDDEATTGRDNFVEYQDVPWYLRGNFGGNPGTVSVSTDPGGASPTESFGSQHLSYGQNSIQNVHVFAPFSDTALGAPVGASITLSAEFRYDAVVPNTPTGLKLGLFSDPGGPISDHNSGMSTDDAAGYYVSIATGTEPATTSFIERESAHGNPSGSDPILQTGDELDPADDSIAPGKISDTNIHTLVLQMVRLEEGVELTFLLDGTEVARSTDTTLNASSFNLLAIASAGTSSSWRLDNVTLTSVVPEPSVLGLAGVSMLGLLRRRRGASL